MAIADIITRIEQDAQAEADALLATARDRADAMVAAAKTEAEHDAARIRSRGAEAARVEAETLLANARLAARDGLLGAKREIAERVLDEARERLESLSDDEYAAFIAREVVHAAVPGQVVRVAAADKQRLASLGERLAAAGAPVTISGEAEGLTRGVRVEGDGVRVEVSPAAYVAERHDALLPLAVRALFPEEG